MSPGAPPTAPEEQSTLSGLTETVSTTTLWARRGALFVLSAVVVAALCGYLGLRTQKVSASANGYDLSVTYPGIARAGLDVVWTISVHRDGGLGDKVVLRVTGDYADILESQDLTPEPDSETSDGEYDYLTFTAPSGDTLLVDFDAYVQPASQQGRRANVAVLGADRRPLVQVDYRTRLVP